LVGSILVVVEFNYKQVIII